MRVLFLILCLIKATCCFVSSYGEKCNYTAECTDHRMICSSDGNNISVCLCDRFHEWKGAYIGCAQKYNATTIMSMVVYIKDSEAFVANLERIFLGQKLAGYFVLCVCFLTMIVVMSYCYCIKKTDKALKETLDRLQTTSKSRMSTHKIDIKHI